MFFYFQYYSMWVSLLGTFLCVAVMFLMDWVTALITFAIVGILYFYINYRKPGTLHLIKLIGCCSMASCQLESPFACVMK